MKNEKKYINSHSTAPESNLYLTGEDVFKSCST